MQCLFATFKIGSIPSFLSANTARIAISLSSVGFFLLSGWQRNWLDQDRNNTYFVFQEYIDGFYEEPRKDYLLIVDLFITVKLLVCSYITICEFLSLCTESRKDLLLGANKQFSLLKRILTYMP
jgi:hypothetical protein